LLCCMVVGHLRRRLSGGGQPVEQCGAESTGLFVLRDVTRVSDLDETRSRNRCSDRPVPRRAADEVVLSGDHQGRACTRRCPREARCARTRERSPDDSGTSPTPVPHRALPDVPRSPVRPRPTAGAARRQRLPTQRSGHPQASGSRQAGSRSKTPNQATAVLQVDPGCIGPCTNDVPGTNRTTRVMHDSSHTG
jgi:hypothetical protein